MTASGEARHVVPPGSWRSRSAFVIWLLVGVLISFHPALRHGWERPLEGYADSHLVSFVLEHAHRALIASSGASSPWRPPVFHPFAASGSLTESLLGILPFYSLGRELGWSPLESSLLAQLLQSVATFGLAFLLFRRGLAASPHEAGFAALLVAFGAPKIARIYHPQLFAQVPLFLALLVVQRWLRRSRDEPPKARTVLLFAALLAAQFYSCVYVALLALLLGLASLPFLAIFKREREVLAALLGQRWKAWLSAMLLLFVLLVPLLSHYSAAAGASSRPGYARLVTLQPPPLALLNPGERSWLGRPLALWTGIPEMPYSWEFSLGIGLVATGFVIAGLREALRTPWLRLLLAGSTLAWFLVMRWPGGFSLWRSLVELLPALGVLRAISRLHLLILPILAATAMLGLRAASRRWGAVAAALLALIAVAEQGRAWGMREPALRVTAEQVANVLPSDCPAFFLSSIGESAPDHHVQIAAMWAALSSGTPTINGYSGYPPKGWRLTAAHEARLGEGDLRARLSAWLELSNFRGELCWLRVDPDAPGAPSFHLERMRRP